MKVKRVIGYICVTAIMAVTGFAIGAGIGFIADLGFLLMGKFTNWFHTVMMGTILGMAFALSVYAENPLVTVLNWLEKNSSVGEK
jgi:hypothetical protein